MSYGKPAEKQVPGKRNTDISLGDFAATLKRRRRPCNWKQASKNMTIHRGYKLEIMLPKRPINATSQKLSREFQSSKYSKSFSL
jgi:hypothetical protein